MPKRLLFVDDEAMILDGLRRALHGMRGEWEMHFVDSAAAALQALDKQAYDAIVTDMRMPLMDGAQLLEAVKQRHPEMIRMVLSGQSSRAAVLRSISPAHQFLSKPCDPKELVLRLGAGLCHARSSRESISQDDCLALAIDPEPADPLRGTDGGVAFGRPVARANRTHHFEGCSDGGQDPATGEFGVHWQLRTGFEPAASGVFDWHRDGAHTGVVGPRVFAVRRPFRGCRLPAGAMGAQCGHCIAGAAHRHVQRAARSPWWRRVSRQDCCTISGRWFCSRRCPASTVLFCRANPARRWPSNLSIWVVHTRKLAPT